MSSFVELFTGREDRAHVLTEIVESGLARCGVTLIAHVERATQEVLDVRSMPTPEPLGDAVAEPVGGLYPLSRQLCALATDMVPRRQWAGDRWGPITGELLTVVCRDGKAAISAREEQFFWGWRYSNHPTAALHGDIYVVTPSGWAGLLGQWSGPAPALRLLPDEVAPLAGSAGPQPPVPFGLAGPNHAGSAVPDVEGALALGSAGPSAPHAGECLVCYVSRMLQQFGCDNQLRFARRYRDACAPRATGLEKRLASMGGFCDCEVLLNAYDLRREHWLLAQVHEEDGCTVIEEDEQWPDPLPACTGVRAGSTQPCRLWQRVSW